jgi:hypothetical protein
VLPDSGKNDAEHANLAIALAKHGFVYAGPSLPHWYGAEDFARLLRAAPAEATVGDVLGDLGLGPPAEFASLAAHTMAANPVALLRRARQHVARITPEKIGRLGPGAYEDCVGYASKAGVHIERAGGRIPFVVEAHVRCERSEAAEKSADCSLTINRTPSLTRVYASWEKNTIRLVGCGLYLLAPAPMGSYDIDLSIHATYPVDHGRQGSRARSIRGGDCRGGPCCLPAGSPGEPSRSSNGD